MQAELRRPGTPNQTRTTFAAIPPGAAGTRATLRLMANFIRQGREDIIIREKALALTRNLPEKAWLAEAKTIFRFVQRRIRYVRDPVDLEAIAEARKTLEYGQGDCDDKVVLCGSLLQSIGHPVRLVAVAYDGNPYFEHVLLETLSGNHWYPMEVTEPLPFGVFPGEDRVTDEMIEHIELP